MKERGELVLVELLEREMYQLESAGQVWLVVGGNDSFQDKCYQTISTRPLLTSQSITTGLLVIFNSSGSQIRPTSSQLTSFPSVLRGVKSSGRSRSNTSSVLG